MPATNGKQVVYYYDGDQTNPDVEEDFIGKIEIPSNGSVIRRRGKLWEVVIVNEKRYSDGRLPVFKIFVRTPQSR